MRYVLHSMRMLLHAATQYRASFWMQTVSQIVMVGGDLMAVLILMGRFTRMGQWESAEVLFFFGAMQIAFALTECFGRGISSFSRYVGSGDFDAMLLRPRPLLLQVICHQLDLRRLGAMLVGVMAMGVACASLTIAWTAAKVLALLLSILGSVLLLTGLFLIEATVSFFSVRSIEMVNTLTYGGRQVCQYPVDIYPRPLRVLFTWVVPLALCLHLPVSWVLNRPLWEVPEWCVFLAPVSGALIFVLMTCVWYVGVRHYRSTGS